MTRYIRLPTRQYVDEWQPDVSPQPPMPTVCDHEAVETGLLFADGTPILRASNPIGFGREDEW